MKAGFVANWFTAEFQEINGNHSSISMTRESLWTLVDPLQLNGM